MISVGIVCNYPHPPVYLSHLLPMRHLPWQVVLNCLELIRISVFSIQLITPMLVKITNLLHPQLLIVLIERVFKHKSVCLAIIRIFLYFGLYIESGRLPQRCANQELILLYVDLRAPGRRHVQSLSQILELVIIVRYFSHPWVLVIMNFFILGIVLEIFIGKHDVLPSDRRQVELDLINFVVSLHVDVEVRVVEDRVDKQVWAVLNVVYPAS